MGIMLILGLSACAQTASEPATTKSKTIDDQAMAVIANGFCERSDYLDDHEDEYDLTDSSEYATYLKGAVQTEIDADAELRDANFDDKNLQEDVLSYLNLLDESMDVLNNYSLTTFDGTERWDDVYNQRTQLIKKFVEDYGMTVDEQYQDAIDQMVANGTQVQKQADVEESLQTIFSNVTFEKTDEGYGCYTYSAVVENTTEYTFNDLWVTLALYDADGVRQGETTAVVSTWSAGEKARFEAGSEIDAATVKVELPDYLDYE